MIARMKYFVLDLISDQMVQPNFSTHEEAEAYIASTNRHKNEFTIILQRNPSLTAR